MSEANVNNGGTSPSPDGSAPANGGGGVPLEQHGRFNMADRAVLRSISRVTQLKYGVVIDPEMFEPMLPEKTDGILRTVKGIAVGIAVILIAKVVHDKIQESVTEREREWVAMDTEKRRQRD
jgi:hypothetical protein